MFTVNYRRFEKRTRMDALKKYAVLIVAVLLCNLLTGCKSEVKTNPVSSSITYEIQSIPEGGWTVQELAKTIRINGNTIENPFTVDNLGEKYSFVGDSTCVEYNGIMSFVVAFTDESVDGNDRLKEVKKIGTVEDYMDEEFTNALTINGIGLGASREEAELAFGEPSIVDGMSYKYCENMEDEHFLLIWFDDNEKIKNMFFSYN